MSSAEAESIIKPVFNDFNKAFEEQQYDKLLGFFHPDAVVIETGKKGVYGNEAIKQGLMEFAENTGKASVKITNEQYQMTQDYIIFSCDHETTTEKTGVISGKINQIWKKVDGKYLLLRDEYGPA